ncbi:MAG: TetR/AcrR family transcriptional regulator [Propionibacterium sp.]
MTNTAGRPRRRGAVLERAILDAAWQQLSDKGFENFSYESVAARAGTSKPVLYRRWPTRSELVVAVLRHRITERSLYLPDTGSLRGDVIDMMGQVNEKRAEMFALQTGAGLYFEQTHVSPAQLRERALAGLPSSMDMVLARARARGELGVELPEGVASLPFELLRAQILMTMVPLSQEAIVSIVDEIFLPLVTAYDKGLVPPAEPGG